MNNEMPTWRPWTWTPEERKLHEETLERINKLNEEIIKDGGVNVDW